MHVRRSAARRWSAPSGALVRADPDAAGRLLLELLPLQRVVYPHPVAYDLVLGARRAAACRSPSPADPHDRGAERPAPPSGGRLPGRRRAGPDRPPAHRRPAARRLRAGVAARVRGRREGVAALSRCSGTPLDLAGAAPRPACGLDPAHRVRRWSPRMIDRRGPRPSGSRSPTRLRGRPDLPHRARRRRPLVATRIAPEGGRGATMHCPADELLRRARRASASPGLTVDGDEGALARAAQVDQARTERVERAALGATPWPWTCDPAPAPKLGTAV